MASLSPFHFFPLSRSPPFLILRGNHVRLYDLSPPLLESGSGLAVRGRGRGVVVDTLDELLHALEGCAEDAERGEFLFFFCPRVS